MLDPSPRVRAALGDALRRIPVTEPDTIALIMRLGRERITGDPWGVYDRDFERYLVRWALEQHPEQVVAFLDSPLGRALPVESRLLAVLALEPRAAATALVTMLSEIDRPIDDEEIRMLASQVEMPEVASALGRLATAPASRGRTLRALLRFRTSLKNPGLGPIVARAATQLLAASANDADTLLALELAGGFAVRGLQPQVTALCIDPSASRDVRRAAIRGCGRWERCRPRPPANCSPPQPTIRRPDPMSSPRGPSRETPPPVEALVNAWDELSFFERQTAASLLSRHRDGAKALVAAVTADDIDVSSLPLGVLGDLLAVLGNDPTLEKLWADLAAVAPSVLRFSGAAAGAGPTVSLDGAFTVEAWAHLEAPIGNEDGLLAGDGLIDMNFHDGSFRVWTKGHADIAVAKSKATPDQWRHYAVTRDAEGTFRIYIDGELDAESRARETVPYPELRIGWSTPRRGGTRGRLAEFRVWNTARTAEEIRADFDRSYVGDDRRPDSLVSSYGGSDWGDLLGDARVEPAIDAPMLVTAADIEKRTEKFARYRQLAGAGGDPAKGRNLFTTRCLTCHQQGGHGGKIGPALDGLWLTGPEAILRNVLTPNAAMEGGYRAFRVVTRDGRVVQGLLVSQDTEAIVIRQPDTADLRIPARTWPRPASPRSRSCPKGSSSRCHRRTSLTSSPSSRRSRSAHRGRDPGTTRSALAS